MSAELLRDICLDAAGGTYRLRLWSTNKPDNRNNSRTRIAYAFECWETNTPDGTWERAAVIFNGDDFCSSPLHAEDSDNTVRALLAFLTLRPGDTDPDYFADYTPAQHAFASGDAEELSMYADERNTEPFSDWPEDSE